MSQPLSWAASHPRKAPCVPEHPPYSHSLKALSQTTALSIWNCTPGYWMWPNQAPGWPGESERATGSRRPSPSPGEGLTSRSGRWRLCLRYDQVTVYHKGKIKKVTFQQVLIDKVQPDYSMAREAGTGASEERSGEDSRKRCLALNILIKERGGID